jgi:preprotein translocase SecE subunit
MAVFENYRRGAGRKARSAALLMLLFLHVWGCYAFFEYGNTRLDRLLGIEDAWFGKTLVSNGGTLTEWITPSLFFALGIFVIGLGLLRWYLNTPRFVDLLIATESELKKVRWAPKSEIKRATAVTLYYVFWFATIIFAMDLTFSLIVGTLQQQNWKTVGWGRVVTMVFRLDPPPGMEPGKKPSTPTK